MKIEKADEDLDFRWFLRFGFRLTLCNHKPWRIESQEWDESLEEEAGTVVLKLLLVLTLNEGSSAPSDN